MVTFPEVLVYFTFKEFSRSNNKNDYQRATTKFQYFPGTATKCQRMSKNYNKITGFSKTFQELQQNSKTFEDFLRNNNKITGLSRTFQELQQSSKTLEGLQRTTNKFEDFQGVSMNNNKITGLSWTFRNYNKIVVQNVQRSIRSPNNVFQYLTTPNLPSRLPNSNTRWQCIFEEGKSCALAPVPFLHCPLM